MSRADQFDPLDDATRARWMKFAKGDVVLFPKLVGLVIEDVRTDYCRMRLPFKPELLQPAGLVHGGAIATLLDSVVVPAVGAAYGPQARYSTIDMHVQFMSAVTEHDIVAEGWVVKRGRSVVFCEAEARRADDDRMIARSVLTYSVS